MINYTNCSVCDKEICVEEAYTNSLSAPLCNECFQETRNDWKRIPWADDKKKKIPLDKTKADRVDLNA